MKNKNWVLAVMLVLSIIITSFRGTQPVMAAENEEHDKKYDIEIVVDASSSLLETDQGDNRYTAIDIFLHALSENGNNAGSVVFTSKIEEDTGLSEMTDKNTKEKLSKQIKSYVPEKGDTNIGLALQTACERLLASDSGSEKIILLLSDGNTYLGSKDADEASLKIEHEAIARCAANDIKVYGICLNTNGTANLQEFKDMTSSTSGAFLEVKSSENLVSALKDFYGRIFNTKFIYEKKIIKDGIAAKTIEVPSYGIQEMNITINNASKLTAVTLTMPDGTDMSANEFDGISSLIGDYYFIKVKEPDAGLWIITAKGEDGTEITFDFVFNANNSIVLETVSDEELFSLNENIEFMSGFSSEGKKLTGKDYYDNYTGALAVYMIGSDEETPQYYAMEPDGENGFRTTLAFDREGSYRVNAVMSCGEFERMTDAMTITVGNALPVFSDGKGAETVKITKLFNQKKSINISQYFTDKEEQNLTYSILSSSYDNDEIECTEDGQIILKKLVSGDLTVQAKDSDGGTGKGVIHIKVRNLTWIVGLLLMILILGLGGFTLFKVIKAKKTFFSGYLNVFSASQVDDSNSMPVSGFKGKYALSNFNLMNHQFDNGMYFKVVPDQTVPGDGSHRLQLISSKTFYYLSSSGETAVKSLDMVTGMTYDIRSSSQEDPAGYNDTISISLEESY